MDQKKTEFPSLPDTTNFESEFSLNSTLIASENGSEKAKNYFSDDHYELDNLKVSSEQDFHYSKENSSLSIDKNPFDIVVKKRIPDHPVKPIIQQIIRRYRLTNGNLVINCPVPDILLQYTSNKDIEEFSSMRYTAVTSDPDSFMLNNYMLRTQIYGRRTEIFVVVTMYNEDEILFTRSMYSIMKNIRYMCSEKLGKKHHQWGPDGWKNIVICIVSDGREKINPRVLSCLGIMGVFQENIAKSHVNGNPVKAHIYEYTSQICVDSDLKIKGSEMGFSKEFCTHQRSCSNYILFEGKKSKKNQFS
jgi:hypothetical protein